VLRAATLHFFDDKSSGEDDNNSDGEDPNKIETDAEGYVIHNSNKNDDNNADSNDNDSFTIGSNNNSSFIINNDSNNKNNNKKSYKSYNNDINENKDNNNYSSNKDKDESIYDGNHNKYGTRTSGHVASTSDASWAFLSAKDKKLLPHRKEGEATTSSVVAARQALSFAADLPLKQATTAVSAIIATTTTTTTNITTGSISSKNGTSRSLRNATSAAIDAKFDSGDEGYELFLNPF
jgi:hypothetical protein